MTTLKPDTVMITGARAPVAVHLGRLFSDAGIRVVFADTFLVPISAVSQASSAFVTFPSPRTDPEGFQNTLSQAVSAHNVQAIVPTCEEVFHLAQCDLPVPVIAPPIDLLARVHNKHDFLQLLTEMGLAVPETRLLRSIEDVSAVADAAGELVFKPVWSRLSLIHI